MVRRGLVVVAVALTLTACAGGPLAAPRPGTISGQVSTRTCGGAARENQAACRFHPAAGITLTFRQLEDGDISFATTDAQGAYSISLPAGEYQVGLKDPIPQGNFGGPRVLTVTAGHGVTADFSYTIQLL